MHISGVNGLVSQADILFSTEGSEDKNKKRGKIKDTWKGEKYL